MAGFIKRFIPARFRSNEIEIPVVRLQGIIMSGDGSPLRQPLSLANCAKQLDKAFAMKKAPAVAIVINSPGGSPVQSRLIYQRIRHLAEQNNKRVLVFVEDAAASGGYMIAIAGDEIYADPSSIVGSIGVVSASFGFTELLNKIGVERRVYTAGKNKVSLDPFQPAKKADIDHIKALQLEIHETFIDMVKQRRGSKLADNDDLFTGMFWTGKTAQTLGLIDGLGDIRTIVQQRFGKDAKLQLIGNARGLLSRKPASGIMGEAMGNALAEKAFDNLEERAIWARLGL